MRPLHRSMTTEPSDKQWRRKGCRTWRGKGLLCMREKKKASQKTRRQTGGGTRGPGGGRRECDQWPWGLGGHRTEIALQDGWQRNPMSLWGNRHREVRGHAQPRKDQKNPTRNHRGEARHGNKRRGGEKPHVNLVPNLSWQVQAHMARKRSDTTRSSTDEQ